jgi:hypothetical protein
LVIQFEENRIRQQKIEVKALIALMKYGNQYVKSEATKALRRIAFPETVAEEINQETHLEQYRDENGSFAYLFEGD